MGITGIDHLYAETTRWSETVDFWERLGFEFVEEWGSEGHRAGRLECNDARLVLAEITDGDPAFSVFFDLADADDVSDLPGVVTPLSNTHWGTRWIRVADPEGRVHALEEHS
jgi:uncharacterized glyoxalase superfamily protein PhnB